MRTCQIHINMSELLESIKKRIKSILDKTDYIKKYYLAPSVVFCVLFLLGLALIGCFTFNSKDWTIGIVVLLFLALILGLLAVISVIAMYREISRKQARMNSDEIADVKRRLERLENK